MFNANRPLAKQYILLVPAQLYVHEAAAGEKISLTLGDRDAIVMIK